MPSVGVIYAMSYVDGVVTAAAGAPLGAVGSAMQPRNCVWFFPLHSARYVFALFLTVTGKILGVKAR